MAGVNFDAASIGGGYFGGGLGCGVQPVIDISDIFGGHRGHHDDYGNKGYGCCPPATCKDVNDVDRDVLKTGFDVQKGQWDVDRDVLLGDKCIEEKICDSTHKLEKDIFGVDRDLLLGFKESQHQMDKCCCEIKTEICEVKDLVKTTALKDELRDEMRANKEKDERISELVSKINKKDTVAEILAALGVSPVIATSSTTA